MAKRRPPASGVAPTDTSPVAKYPSSQVVYKVPEEINRLRCRVAVLLACARTRIDKARWNSVQQLLQDEACRRGDPPPGVVSRLVREQAYLEATIAGDAEKDTAIMPHL